MSIKAKVSPRQILKETFLLSVNYIVDQPLVQVQQRIHYKWIFNFWLRIGIN